uniref:Uncharacterized protein n=1 Tax=viral metagenome TaxID=1070528 RepID=A0A6M3J6M6_9ZZZZ
MADPEIVKEFLKANETPKKHAGLVQISAQHLLDLLDLHGGTIWRAELSRWGQLEILIEHPDLPELYIGDVYTPVLITMRTECDDNGHIIKTERIDPPKGVSNGQKAH